MYSFIISRLQSWRLVLVLAVVVWSLASSATAQVNAYTTTTGTGGTWYDLSSGTVIMSAENDDDPSAVQDIGFDFSLGATVYTQYSVSPDGFLRFGGIAASYQFNNTNSSRNQPKLFPWWNNLSLGASGQGGEIRYQLFGTAPNRVLVIQWGVTIPWSSNAANATFQVSLSEGTNTIQYVYGSPNTATDGSFGASIGISTSTTDFITLDAARVPSTTVFTTNITNYDGTNYPYVLFTPPPPCTNPPTAGTSTSSVPKICANVAFSLDLTGQSGGLYQTYQWQSSPDGSTWSDISGATSASYSGIEQTSATYYHCNVTCGTTVASSSVFVDMEDIDNCYCTPEYSDGCTDDDYIANFTFAGINNTTTCSPDPYYTYYPNLIANVNQGGSYSVSITLGNNLYSEVCRIWVDFNDNGSFEDSGEMILAQRGVGSMSNAIIISNNAPLGTHRMRVRGVYNNSNFTSCDYQYYGETEDYKINITPAPPCQDPPIAGTANSLSANVCKNISFKLYLTGNSNGLNQTYQWQSSPDNSIWTDISNANTTIFYATQAAATYYRCNVTCGTTVASSAVFVGMKDINDCYCTPSFTSGCSGGDGIFRFKFSDINNATSCSPSPNYYTNYSGLTANVLAGSSYSLFVVFGYSDEFLKIWVDFNDDGDFDDPGEEIFAQAASGYSISKLVAIPGNAPAGVHRMRVRCVWNNSAFTTCSNQAYGETEDYKINIMIPPPCQNPPTAGTANSPVTVICPNISFPLNLTGNSAGLNQTYQWQSSLDGSSWTDISNATDTLIYVSQTAATYYRCNVICGTTVASTPVFVDMEIPTKCYCQPSHSVGCVVGDYISNVTFAGINNTTGCSDQPYYYTYYQNLTANVVTGTTYPISLSFQHEVQYCKIWVDFNDDTDFDDPGEVLFEDFANANYYLNGSIAIPNNANPGVHRMRIRTTRFNAPGSCTEEYFGETEDYNINVMIPVCPTPTNLRVVNLSAYSATLDWDLPTGPPYTTPDSVVTYFRLVGAVNWQRRVWTDIDSIRIFKLKPDNQAYEWKIAVYCNGTPLPRVSGPNFTTAMACVPASNLVASGVTNNQATITWDAASIADSFYVNYRKTGGIWLFKVAMTNSATLTGLSANTTYEVKVKTFCNTGAFTGYAAMGSFTTNVSKTDDFVSDISAYPNPMHDILVITAMPEIDSKLEVSFVNILGVTVKRYQETVTTGSIVREISVSDLETGIYMVEISCGDVRRVVKIVKE
ncbi:MAG: GEVED domain-containing protein [Bacteroidia bacterium]|nr:GEVED domain-containing protein [Bacteroidia bacterium]